MKTEYLLEMTVKELLQTDPGLVKLFMELRLECIGCPMDELHTLADVAEENNLDLDHLLEKIQSVLSQTTP